MSKKLLLALGLAMCVSLASFASCGDNSNSSSEDSMSTTSTCEHVYDNACDADCNTCGEERTPEEHVYDNACDATCNVCGDTRTPAEHVYDDACDVTCNVCNAERTVAGHTYDNACDTDCNVCGDTRTPADHAYDNACDIDCNVCGAERTVGGHAYDDSCDTDCNVCGDVREIEHTYDNACDVDCNVCGTEREASEHVFDNASDVDCNECGATKEVVTLTARQDIDLDLTFTDALVTSSDNATLDVSEVANVASVSSATYNDTAIDGVSYADGKITLPKAAFGTAFGEATLVINVERNDGSLALVNMPILLITKAISTVEELDAWYTLADALDKNAKGKSYPYVSDGYFVLDSNITYNKAYNAWPAWDAADGKWRKADVHGFKGTLDGRGYSIDGLEIATNFSAFITLLHADGEVKNIGFTNAKLSGVASGYVCAWGGGTMENIYVQYAEGVFGAAGGYNGTFFAADNTRGITENGGLKIYDCFVDASKITAVGTANKSCYIGYGYSNNANNWNAEISYVTTHGVFALGSANVANKYLIEKEDKTVEFYFPFATAADMLAHSKTQTEIATWNTAYWTIVEGIPTWNHKA